jgi:uncharacterized membrane protein SirB2
MIYYWLKTAHVTTVAFSISIFLLRYYWMVNRTGWTNKRWVRTLSVINDTVLLIAGISLAVLTQQSPHQHPWLMAKLAILLLYILFGTIALKRGKTRRIRIISGVAALICVGYIVASALHKTSTPWFEIIYFF